LKSSGFGFIRPDTSNDDEHNLYFHATGCGGGNSFDSFRARDQVKFEVLRCGRGQTIAKNVTFANKSGGRSRSRSRAAARAEDEKITARAGA